MKASAYILVGGKSSRFGSPKWKADINGKTVLDLILDACSKVEHRFVIGKRKPKSLDVPFIKDALTLDASINGLYTALKHSETQWIFLFSCDLPLIDGEVIQKIWKERKAQIDAVVPLANNHLQPTCALYNKKILSVIRNAVKEKNYSLYDMIKTLNTRTVDFGGDPRFKNMNTVNDLRWVRHEYAGFLSLKKVV